MLVFARMMAPASLRRTTMVASLCDTNSWKSADP
jgi:hypothetical protein